jgi:hypothetical protein
LLGLEGSVQLNYCLLPVLYSLSQISAIPEFLERLVPYCDKLALTGDNQFHGLPKAKSRMAQRTNEELPGRGGPRGHRGRHVARAGLIVAAGRNLNVIKH